MPRVSWWRWTEHAGLAAALVVLVWLSASSRDLRERYEHLTARMSWLHPGAYVPPVRASTLRGDSVVLGAPEAGTQQVVVMFTTTCPYCRA